jgi:hypothetical protein
MLSAEMSSTYLRSPPFTGLRVKAIEFDASEMRHFDHRYAGTSHGS